MEHGSEPRKPVRPLICCLFNLLSPRCSECGGRLSNVELITTPQLLVFDIPRFRQPVEGGIVEKISTITRAPPTLSFTVGDTDTEYNLQATVVCYSHTNLL